MIRKANWINIHGPVLEEIGNGYNRYPDDFSFTHQYLWVNTDIEGDESQAEELLRRLGRCGRFMKTKAGSATFDKIENDYVRGFKLDWGYHQTIIIQVSRDSVCERKEIGTKRVDVMGVVGTREEPVYEIQCTPLLSVMGEE